MGLTEKRCARCKMSKPLDDFGNDRNSRSGKYIYCKECAREYRTAWKAANAERHAAYHRKYRENHREKISRRQREWRASNPERDKANSQRYYQENKERFYENMLRWRAANPERAKEMLRLNQRKRKARELGAPTYFITDKDKRRLLNSGCAVSGCSETGRLTIDHVIPLIRGGSHGIGNLQMLCARHNSSKNKKLWIEFRAYLARTEVRCG